MNDTGTPSILTDLTLRRDVLIGRMVVHGWQVTNYSEIFLRLSKPGAGEDAPVSVLIPHTAPNLDVVKDFRGMLDKAEAAYNRGKR